MKNTLIQNLIEEIQSKEIKVVSFDFFDTLVSRRVPRPCDVFYELGRRLLIEEKLDLRITAERFMKLRINAESLARNLTKLKEISLRDIYDQFPKTLFNCSSDELTELEVQIEKEMVFPVAEMIDLVNFASSQGKRVIVVSDTYLSSTDLEEIWGKSTPDVHVEFFVSSEYRTGKYDDLFDVVLRKIKVKPSHVLHVGDNEHSDVIRPSALGLKTFFLPNGTKEFWEKWSSEASEGDYFNQRVAPMLGDAGITAMRCRSVHHIHSSLIDSVNYIGYGATILGPALSSFVHWVKLHANAAYRTVILPIMREGHVISQMLNAYEEDLHVRPVYLSRRLIFQATLVDANSEKLRTLRFGNLDSTVDEYLGLIGLRISEVPSLEDILDSSISNDSIFSRVINSIESGVKLFEKLSDRAREIRQGLLLHIRDVCMLDGELADQVIFVDVGWNATIQKHLNNILTEESINLKVVGLYMMTTPAVNDLIFNGVLAKGLFVDGGIPTADFQLLSRTLEIFEQSCSPNHGSVRGHDLRDGSPILAIDKIPRAQRIEISQVQDGISIFHKIFRKNNDLNELNEIEDLVAPIRNILRRAMLMPTLSEAKLFKNWVHDDNLTSGGISSIVGAESEREILRFKTLRQLVNTGMGQLYWPMGALVLAAPQLASVASTAILKNLPLDYFDNSLDTTSEMSVGADYIFDDSSGFNQPLLKNACGYSYLKFSFPISEAKMLRWKPSSASYNLRIEFMFFTFVANNGLVVKHRIDGHNIDKIAKTRGLVKRNKFTWSSSESDGAFYFEYLRDLGVNCEGTITVEIAFEIDSTVMHAIAVHSESNKTQSLLEFDIEPHIHEGIVNLDSWNGFQIRGDSGDTFLSGKCFSLSGWIIDPERKVISGNIYARFTNQIGESQFILLSPELRPDLAEHFNFAANANSGFAINNVRLKSGKYSLSILRRDGERFLIGTKVWSVQISENKDFIASFEDKIE